MSRSTLRILFTCLMYAGVVLCLYPFLTGHLSSGMMLMIGGLILTVTFGMLRAFCIDGDCPERERSAHWR